MRCLLLAFCLSVPVLAEPVREIHFQVDRSSAPMVQRDARGQLQAPATTATPAEPLPDTYGEPMPGITVESRGPWWAGYEGGLYTPAFGAGGFYGSPWAPGYFGGPFGVRPGCGGGYGNYYGPYY